MVSAVLDKSRRNCTLSKQNRELNVFLNVLVQYLEWFTSYAQTVMKKFFIGQLTKSNGLSNGVCSTDLRLDTSTKGLKQVYTSTQEI
jgi:hypothetical protein